MPFSVFIPCKYLSADFVISNAKFFHFSRKATPVDQTIVGKQRFKNHRIGDKRRGAGQENHCAVDALALDVRAIEQLREDQCQDQHNGHLDHKIENRVKQALLERGIL